ncbi:MAG: thymidine kinase [Acidobacteria bacterium]|nr:thymidine kinase [Acidobacteriota bacterium]
MEAHIRANMGWIEVICGSMFSGKSEELIRRLRRAQIARQRGQIFKPRIDSRYAQDQIVSHSDQRIVCQVVASAGDILERLDVRTEVIGIDEGQFFDRELVTVCNQLADMGKRVIVAGLDQDYMGRPFEPMPDLLAIAEYITKTLAICVRCGNPANHTQRLIESTERVVVGASDIYEARCRRCFEPLPAGAAKSSDKARDTAGVSGAEPRSMGT